MSRRHHLYAKLPPSKDLSGHRGLLGISSSNPPSIIGVFVDFNSLFDIRRVIMSSTPIGISTLKPERPPIMQDLINWHQVQGWIKHCTASHDCGRFAVSELPRGFRLIDIDNRQLTSESFGDGQESEPVKFVALSYVWGQSVISDDNALLSSNKRRLTVANGLDTLNLPRTIEDAITICKGLKRRYLWVDRFCIQQDSEQDKRQQIDAMASIYSSAEFTIINSSGAEMYSPIPGVTEKRNAFQSKVITGGVEVTNIYPSLGVALKNST